MMDELDAAVADLQAKRRERAERRSDWQPVDLAPVLAGEVLDPPPSILQRTDEVGLIYPAKVHLVYGEPESAKGWLVLAACAEQMRLGEPVLYIDFEDAAPTAVTRLRALGATDEQIADLFTYIRPDTPADAEVVANLPGIGAALVVLDGVTEAMTLNGLELKDNADVAKFVELLARPLAYAIEVIRPFGRGMTGLSRLTVTKDRPGFVRPASAHGKGAGDVHLHSAEDGSVQVQIEPTVGTEQEGWRPTYYMEKVSRYLETAGEQTVRGVRADVKGKGEYVSASIHQLVAEGYVARRDGPRESVLVSSIKPFREDEGSPCPSVSRLCPGHTRLTVSPCPVLYGTRTRDTVGPSTPPGWRDTVGDTVDTPGCSGAAAPGMGGGHGPGSVVPALGSRSSCPTLTKVTPAGRSAATPVRFRFLPAVFPRRRLSPGA